MSHEIFDFLEKSREKGRSVGRMNGAVEMSMIVARKLYETGLTDISEISSIVGLNEEQLKGVLE